MGTPAEAPGRTIVVGVDGSDRDQDALALAKLLGSLLGARLIAATVRREGSRHEGAGVPAGARRVSGTTPAHGLRDLAESEAADMIVVGSTHRAGVGRVLPGAVGDRLLQDAPCAIAIAPLGFAGRDDAYPRVLAAGFDLTDESHAAVELAAGLANAAEATIRILSVIDPRAAGDLRMATLHLRNSLPPRLRADARILHGTPTRELIDQAEQGVDLIVLGSRGHGPLGRVVVGSVASEVVRFAPCPVLIVPRRAASAKAASAGPGTGIPVG